MCKSLVFVRDGIALQGMLNGRANCEFRQYILDICTASHSIIDHQQRLLRTRSHEEKSRRIAKPTVKHQYSYGSS